MGAASMIGKGRVYPACKTILSGQRETVPRVIPPDPRLIERRRRVADRIRAARLAADLSQQDIVHRTGLDRSTYQDIERARSSPLLDNLFRIADAIGVPLSELVREERPLPRERQGPPDPSSP
ncbi:helix-turn-helix domain-containing protein [Streptomyces sp. 24-1644]|uniref:helix-turn-helix domain-containing protein n=1 Tax=Streptomyces sp. 24-1644 TaxID=3457315 RepID=UPI003FA6A6A6